MTAAPIHVRAADLRDLEAVAALAQASFGDSAWSRSQLAAALPGRMWLAEVTPPALAGYVVMQWLGVEAEVESLAVDAAHRRRGIGQALLAAALAEARRRGVREVFLEVRESNRIAQAFYQEFGFRQTGRRPDYYHHPAEAAWLMRTALAD